MNSDRDAKICKYCKMGYHSPFERFEVIETFHNWAGVLKRCTACRALWNVEHDARIVSVAEAIRIYPKVNPEDLP